MSISMPDVRVGDVLLPASHAPVVGPKTMLKETMERMTAHRLGIACIIDDSGKLLGIFTDGDIRRMLLKDQKPFSALFADDAIQHANRAPTTVLADDSLVQAVQAMERKGIWDLPVVDRDGRFLGLLHLHPAIKALLGL